MSKLQRELWWLCYHLVEDTRYWMFRVQQSLGLTTPEQADAMTQHCLRLQAMFERRAREAQKGIFRFEWWWLR
jgi:hypothetical protein